MDSKRSGDWRRRWLKPALLKLGAVASAVGYESESAFGKVFRRVMGVAPGKYRRAHPVGTE